MRTAAVIGTGLIGTSVALALTRRGVGVYLADRDESTVRTAASLGAGEIGDPPARADLAVIAVPPAYVAATLEDAQRRGLAAAYTDVASVKAGPQDAAQAQGVDQATYIGGHPLAGRETSGPLNARADLFDGRPWVLTPTAATSRDALNRALELISLCGAVPVVMDAADRVGLPTDPSFRAAFASYIEWGTRLAEINSEPGRQSYDAPIPQWGWGVMPPYRG